MQQSKMNKKRSTSLAHVRSNLNRYINPRNLQDILLFEQLYKISPRKIKNFKISLRLQYVYMLYEAANSHQVHEDIALYKSPSIDTIARLARCSRSSVLRHNPKLEDSLHIRIHRRKQNQDAPSLSRFSAKRGNIYYKVHRRLTNIVMMHHEFLAWLREATKKVCNYLLMKGNEMLKARKEGFCPRCNQKIRVGEEIESDLRDSGKRWLHYTCWREANTRISILPQKTEAPAVVVPPKFKITKGILTLEDALEACQ